VATARPIPRLAPVTSAARPASEVRSDMGVTVGEGRAAAVRGLPARAGKLDPWPATGSALGRRPLEVVDSAALGAL
jgi:hypothetical protein